MAITELARDCFDFALALTEACNGANGNRMIKELLIRSCHGMAHHTSEASYNRNGRAYDEYCLANSDCREAKYWFHIAVRARAFSEPDANRLERKLASLAYRLNKAEKEYAEKGERKLKRFPRPTIAFSSSRLKARGWLMKDVEAYTELCASLDSKDLSFKVMYDKQKTADLIKEYTLNSDFYVITRKNDDSMIGCVRLIPDGLSGTRYKLEYAILPQYRGCGYSYDVLTSSFEFLVKKKQASALCVYLSSDVMFLKKTLVRYGFEMEGKLLSYCSDGGDALVLTKTK